MADSPYLENGRHNSLAARRETLGSVAERVVAGRINAEAHIR